MNIPTSNSSASSTGTESHHPYYEEETTSIQAVTPAPLSPFRTQKTLVLEPGAEIASHLCLKTGRPTKQQITLALRNPWKPGTWFASREKVRIGLSRQSLENFRLTRAIAWSFMILGIAMMSVSFSYGIFALVPGILLSLAGLMIRAAFPVWCSKKVENVLIIQGCGEGFLRQYPAKPEEAV